MCSARRAARPSGDLVGNRARTRGPVGCIYSSTTAMGSGIVASKLSAGSLLLVQPATILGWHPALVHHRWAAFGRRRGPGRPKLPTECQELVLRVARENPL